MGRVHWKEPSCFSGKVNNHANPKEKAKARLEED
jgi:hypothetical protein